MVSSLTYRNPASSHTGPSVKPKPVPTMPSLAFGSTTSQNCGDSACSLNSRGERGAARTTDAPIASSDDVMIARVCRIFMVRFIRVPLVKRLNLSPRAVNPARKLARPFIFELRWNYRLAEPDVGYLH